MPRDPRAWLTDVVAAGELLVEFTRGKTFTDYAGDVLLRSEQHVASVPTRMWRPSQAATHRDVQPSWRMA